MKYDSDFEKDKQKLGYDIQDIIEVFLLDHPDMPFRGISIESESIPISLGRYVTGTPKIKIYI